MLVVERKKLMKTDPVAPINEGMRSLNAHCRNVETTKMWMTRIASSLPTRS